MTRFITNQDSTTLQKVFSDLIPGSDAIDILVGYFYFSGFDSVQEELKEKKLRILVGLEADLDPAGRLREFAIRDGVAESRSVVRDSFYDSLVNIFNASRLVDSAQHQKSFRLFLDKIQKGRAGRSSVSRLFV